MSKTKRNRTQYKKAVKNIIEELKSIMLLGHYTINIFYMDEEREKTLGECEMDEPGIKYYSVNLKFYPEHFKIYKKEEDYMFVKTIVHEMCHIITEPLYIEAYQAFAPIARSNLEIIREQTTEKIAVIIYNLWKKCDKK